jgi:hypothetical protein
MSSTHRHLLLDFFWQVISGPPCIIYQGTDNIAGNFFEQSSHTSVCSKKITRGRQPEGNFERQTRVLDCKKKFLAIYICPEVYSEENRPKKFFPRSIISEIFPRENFRLIKL